MRVGLILPLFSGDADRVLSYARRAEGLGFDGVFAFDHLFPPGAPSDRPSLEAFATLAAVASSTRRIALGTLVTRSVFRSAGLVAKLTSQLDDLSGGRMILGIGSGDAISEPEHATAGIAYLGTTERRAHLVETVRAVRSLFREEPWPGGDAVPPVAGPLLPAPARAGGPPVWIGGASDAVVRIAASEGDAWNGWGLALTAFARKADLLRRTASEAGRSVDATWAGIAVVGRDEEEADDMMRERSQRDLVDRNVWAGGAGALADHLARLAEAGAVWAVLLPGGPEDRLGLIAEQVLPRVRDGA